MNFSMLAGAHSTLIPIVTDLHALAAKDSASHAPDMARAIQSLYEAPAESWAHDMITDMLIDLFGRVDMPVLTMLTAELVHLEHVPVRLFLALIDHNEDLAVMILKDGPVFDPYDLMYRLSAGRPREIAAIAARPDLPASVRAMIDAMETAPEAPEPAGMNVAPGNGFCRKAGHAAAASMSSIWACVSAPTTYGEAVA